MRCSEVWKPAAAGRTSEQEAVGALLARPSCFETGPREARVSAGRRRDAMMCCCSIGDGGEENQDGVRASTTSKARLRFSSASKESRRIIEVGVFSDCGKT